MNTPTEEQPPRRVSRSEMVLWLAGFALWAGIGALIVSMLMAGCATSRPGPTLPAPIAVELAPAK